MIGLMLVGCGVQLGDHCIIDQAPGGTIRLVTERDMKGGKLVREQQYFAVAGAPSATAEHEYVDGLWVEEQFNGDPGFSDEPTQRTVIRWDDLGQPIAREVYDLPSGELESLFEYSWENGRLTSTQNQTLFTSWEEIWTWEGDSAVVLQSFLGGRVVREFRDYTPSVLSWPVLPPDENLPGLAFTSVGVDLNENGTREPDELTFEQEVDDNGVPSFSRFYDATGSLFTQSDWGDCPALGPPEE